MYEYSSFIFIILLLPPTTATDSHPQCSLIPSVRQSILPFAQLRIMHRGEMGMGEMEGANIAGGLGEGRGSAFSLALGHWADPHPPSPHGALRRRKEKEEKECLWKGPGGGRK
jgi:hypothetical protein